MGTGDMDKVKTSRMGGKIVISGSDRSAVEAAALEAVMKGATNLSKIEPMGGDGWVVTCEDPGDWRSQCQIVKLGMQLLIKGPTEAAVRSQVQALTEKGSRLVSPPAPATGGGWVAICDESDQVYKW
jgi:hypothetical protein